MLPVEALRIAGLILGLSSVTAQTPPMRLEVIATTFNPIPNNPREELRFDARLTNMSSAALQIAASWPSIRVISKCNDREVPSVIDNRRHFRVGNLAELQSRQIRIVDPGQTVSIEFVGATEFVRFEPKHGNVVREYVLDGSCSLIFEYRYLPSSPSSVFAGPIRSNPVTVQVPR